jgi:hypothetical protein
MVQEDSTKAKKESLSTASALQRILSLAFHPFLQVLRSAYDESSGILPTIGDEGLQDSSRAPIAA